MELDKLIERIDKKKITWEGKLKDYERDLEIVNSRLPALEKQRDALILPARAEGDEKAKVKLDTANVEIEKLKKEQHELEVLVEQVQKKISDLEAQKADGLRQKQIFELNNQRDKRLDMARLIETKVDELMPLIADYKALGREMYSQAQKLGVAHGSYYTENRLSSFLHGKFGSILPRDFQSTLGKRVGSLTKDDLETLDAVMLAHNLITKTKERKVV